METQRKKERDSGRERERVFQKRGRRHEREAGEERERERERAHQAKRSAVAVYFPMSS